MGQRPSTRWPVCLLILLLASISFVANFRIALLFESVDVFTKSNILFNADADLMQRAFAVGWAAPRLKHPNLSNFITPPVRAAAWVGNMITRSTTGRAVSEEDVSLGVSPLFGAMKTVVLFLLFRELGAGFYGAAVLCLLDIASASRIVFGSIPESFPLTGFAIACLFWLAVRSLKRQVRVRPFWWIVCGVFATGVTLTNSAIFAIVFFFASFATMTPVQAFWSTARAVLTVAVVTVAIWVSAYTVIRITMQDRIEQVSHAKAVGQFGPTTERIAGIIALENKYLHGEAAQKILQFPLALADTFVPPHNVGILPYQNRIDGAAGPDVMFTFEGVRRLWPTLVLNALAIVLMLLGVGAYMRSAKWRPLAFACAGILLFNLCLHAVYGDELFLYSQHWQVVLMMLFGALFVSRRMSRVATVSTLVFAFAVTWNSLQLLTSMFEALG